MAAKIVIKQGPSKKHYVVLKGGNGETVARTETGLTP
jgi:uncharacterized protein YegP (UPF0339 family)